MPIDYANQKFQQNGFKTFCTIDQSKFFFKRDKNYINYRGFKCRWKMCDVFFDHHIKLKRKLVAELVYYLVFLDLKKDLM